MKIDRVRTYRAPRSNLQHPRNAEDSHPNLEAKHQDKGLRVRTGLRAGDLYMQMPRGSNNRP